MPMRGVPVEAVYRRLRFHPQITSLSEKQKEEIERTIGEAISLVVMKGVIRRLKAQVVLPNRVILETGDVFLSEKLALFLAGIQEVILMAATAGNGVSVKIGELLEKGELARAAIFDAVASETTDHALDWLTRYADQVIRREGKTVVGDRYSPGYGDLGLENQVIFDRLLHLGKIGVTVSPSFMLIPEKSVTAIAGVTEFKGIGSEN